MTDVGATVCTRQAANIRRAAVATAARPGDRECIVLSLHHVVTRSLPAAFETSRLVLRRQHADDARLIEEAIDTSRAHLLRTVGWASAALASLPALTERLAASATAFDAGESWAYSILDSAQSRVLGGVALEHAEPALTALVGPGAVEIGYWLRADATGHGYATEAAAALVDLAFTRLGALHVVVCHDPANAESGGVPRRLGFERLGTVSEEVLPGRQAADGSIRSMTTVWVLDVPSSAHARHA